MARRHIGEETLGLGDAGAKWSLGALDNIAGLIDWSEIDQDLSPIYRSATGEKAWPPLAMLKALLLWVWSDLSDVKLAEALDDRSSFRRFCGFAANELTSERTAFVRFRREPVKHGLDTVLFDAVTRQLDKKNVMVKTGTLVDATIVASTSITKDEEARWVGHRRKAAVHGYKAHVATDADGGIVRCIKMTPANVNDGRMLGAVLPPDPGNVYADLAYASLRNEILIRDAGGASRLSGRSVWGGPEALAKLEAWNREVGLFHRRIEKVFGTCKRSYGLRRMRLDRICQGRTSGAADGNRLQPHANAKHPALALGMRTGYVCPLSADGGQKRLKTPVANLNPSPRRNGELLGAEL